MADEPVLAGPPTVGYPVRKFVRRHRGFVVATGLVVAALAAGAIGTALGLVQAHQARLKALEAANDATQKKELAEARLGQLRTSNTILAQMLKGLNPHLEAAGGPPLLAQVADGLVKAAEKLNGEAIGAPEEVAQIQIELGNTLVGLGQFDKAIPVFTKARETYLATEGPDHLGAIRATNNLAVALNGVGRRTEALPLFEDTVERRKRVLGLNHEWTMTSMHNLAVQYRDMGRSSQALKLYLEVRSLREANLGTDRSDTLNTLDGWPRRTWTWGDSRKRLRCGRSSFRGPIERSGLTLTLP